MSTSTWGDMLEFAGKAVPWREAAEDLTDWVWDHLLNRSDAFGAYRSLGNRSPNESKSYTAPQRDRRAKGALTLGRIKQHFEGRDVGHLIGLHTTSPQNFCRWFVIDIDKHDDKDPATPDGNFRAAVGWHEKLMALGFTPILLNSNGGGGFHLLVVFAKPVSSEKVFAFVQWLVSDYAERGLVQPPETFPKQEKLTQNRRYGNWWRLPGRHHTRAHWSKIWDQNRWMEGHDAIRILLAARGDQPDQIPADLPISATAEASRVVASGGGRRPAVGKPTSHWLDVLQGRAPGGRHEALLQFAGYLLHKGVDAVVTEELCVMWNKARNRPPKPEGRVRATVQDIAQRHAITYHGLPFGAGARGRAGTVRLEPLQ